MYNFVATRQVIEGSSGEEPLKQSQKFPGAPLYRSMLEAATIVLGTYYLEIAWYTFFQQCKG